VTGKIHRVNHWIESLLAFYECRGFTVFDTSVGDRNMENLPDMTLRWTPDSAR